MIISREEFRPAVAGPVVCHAGLVFIQSNRAKTGGFVYSKVTLFQDNELHVFLKRPCPKDAVEALYLKPHENTATIRHSVEATRRNMVLEGNVRNGTSQQTVILDRGAFKHNPGTPNDW